MLAPSRILHSSKFSVSYGNLNQNYYTMALSSPNQDLAEETRAAMERQLEQQTRDATSGVLRRPGRGKRAGQWVQSGGEFNNLTQDEVYGRLRARQGGNSGSGPGGGLRTGGLSSGGLSSGGLSSGGLSQGSGIDWLKANGPDRYSPSRLRQMERNVDITGDAGKLSKVDQVIFDKQESDKAAKAAADAKAAAVQPTAPAAPAQFDSLNTPVGQTAKPAIPPMIARPAEPAAPPVLAKPTAAPASPDPLAPASPNPYSKATQANPDPLAPASPNPYPARSFTPSPNPVLDRAKAELAKPRDLSAAANPAAFQEWRKTDPDAIANSEKHAKVIGDWNTHLGNVNRTKKSAEQNMRNVDTFEEAQSKLGLISIGSDQYNKTKKFADDSYKFGKETAAAVAKNLANPGNLRYKQVPDVLEKPIRTEASISGERLVRDLANPLTGGYSRYKSPDPGTQADKDRWRDGGFIDQQRHFLPLKSQPGPVRVPSMKYEADDVTFPKKVLPPAPASDDRTKASPLAAPSNPLDPVKVSQNPRTRGIPPVGGTPTPPVLQKPTPPNNQSVVGNPANKRKTNPLSNMLKGLV